MSEKQTTDEFSAEIVGLSKRQLTAKVLTIQMEQQKRVRLLGDVRELEEYSVYRDMPVKFMRNLIDDNYKNNAPRLTFYRAALEAMPDDPNPNIVSWKNIPVIQIEAESPIDCDFNAIPDESRPKDIVSNLTPRPRG
jgi:hypothetical protein